MPTYEDLRSYFDETEFLQEAAYVTAKFPIVTGFTLNVDPLWSLLYDVENNLVDWLPAPHWQTDLRDALYDLTYIVTWPYRAQFAERGYRRRDLSFLPGQWKELAEDFRTNTGRSRLPVLMTIVHRALQARPNGGDVPDDVPLLQDLIRTVRKLPVAVRVEERSPARLASLSGEKIFGAGTKSGTLGGVLHDRRGGKSYGVTCSHVAKLGDDVMDGALQRLGICIADTSLAPLSGQTVCDPVNLAPPNPSPGNGPDVNMLDCALIELTAAAAGSPVAGVAPRLSPGQSVAVHGSETGVTHHWLGSLCMSYSFSDGMRNFCFRDSVELIPQPSGILGTKTPPVQGDSGSWVMTGDNPAHWAGLFFGEDGHRGFMIRSRWVHDWATKAAGSPLTP